jgi:hypothetical protein
MKILRLSSCISRSNSLVRAPAACALRNSDSTTGSRVCASLNVNVLLNV